MKRLLSYAISVSVNESRSAMVSGQEPKRPSAAIRSSSGPAVLTSGRRKRSMPRSPSRPSVR